jgi:methylated-DNA-[protein]-cysteine S-methyltransferase
MTEHAMEAALRHAPTTDPVADLAAALARAEAEGLVDVAYARTDSPIGPLLVAATEAGLVRLAFDGEDDVAVLQDLAVRVAPRVVAAPRRLDAVRRELDEYFAGRREHFELALDWRLSRGFRRTVLEHLYADVPYGRTVSYLELATVVGNPKASRAVGTAMATNPIPIVVPCHRVLRSGGHLGGYGGGLAAKRHLLALEAAAGSGTDAPPRLF